MAEWVPPWRPGLPQTLCPGCSKNVIAATTTRGHCRECVERLGVLNVVEPVADPQMTLL